MVQKNQVIAEVIFALKNLIQIPRIIENCFQSTTFSTFRTS